MQVGYISRVTESICRTKERESTRVVEIPMSAKPVSLSPRNVQLHFIGRSPSPTTHMVCTCVPGVWNSSSPKLNGNIFGRTEKKWNSCTLYFRFVLHYTARHRWFNGRMRASHARDPGSIPGRCTSFFQLFLTTFSTH